jgi:hypothetical protein
MSASLLVISDRTSRSLRNLALELDNLFSVGLLKSLELLLCGRQSALIFRDAVDLGGGFLDLTLQRKQFVTGLLLVRGRLADIDGEVTQSRRGGGWRC